MVVGKEGQDRGDVGARASGEPVDGADNALVNFCASFEVRTVWGWRGDGIDGKAQTPGSHVGDAVHCIHAETMGRVLGKCGLGEVGREVFSLARSGEGCAKEVVYVAHEVDLRQVI